MDDISWTVRMIVVFGLAGMVIGCLLWLAVPHDLELPEPDQQKCMPVWTGLIAGMICDKPSVGTNWIDVGPPIDATVNERD